MRAKRSIQSVVFMVALVAASVRLSPARDVAVEQNAGKDSQGYGCKLNAYTGTVPLEQVEGYSAGVADLRGGMDCRFLLNSKLPVFNFHFAGRPDNSLGDIEIGEAGSDKVFQTIENSTYAGDIFPTAAKHVLTAVDVNFDGYDDLQILNNCGATGNCSYDYYVYDPSGRKFVHQDFLSNLSTPSFDKAKKQVTTSSNGSVSDWQKEVYQYENGKYALIHREVSTWDRDRHKVTVNTFELHDGEMKLVDSTSEPE